MIIELQQAPFYREYIIRLGWQIIPIDNVHVAFMRRLPLIGQFLKFQRMNQLPSIHTFNELLTRYHVRRVVIESGSQLNPQEFSTFVTSIAEHRTVISTPYLPTKTIRIDISPDLPAIFSCFSEAKRRSVRRARKAGAKVVASTKIDQMIHIKARSAGLFGRITTHGLRYLYEAASPQQTAIVLSYTDNTAADNDINATPEEKQVATSVITGGVFLIFWQDTAYYWIAGTIKKGKRDAHPTLLVWEALKLAKSRGMKWFDFVGVWDERLPNQGKDWLGFTKFKEGFGGESLYYPIVTAKPRR